MLKISRSRWGWGINQSLNQCIIDSQVIEMKNGWSSRVTKIAVPFVCIKPTQTIFTKAKKKKRHPTTLQTRGKYVQRKFRLITFSMVARYHGLMTPLCNEVRSRCRKKQKDMAKANCSKNQKKPLPFRNTKLNPYQFSCHHKLKSKSLMQRPRKWKEKRS